MEQATKNNIIQQIVDEMNAEELDDFINRLILIRDAKRLSTMGLVSLNTLDIQSIKYDEPKTKQGDEIEIS